MSYLGHISENEILQFIHVLTSAEFKNHFLRGWSVSVWSLGTYSRREHKSLCGTQINTALPGQPPIVFMLLEIHQKMSKSLKQSQVTKNITEN